MYLSSQTPRWQPTNEADLQWALDQGLLEESHYLELKRQLNASKTANTELAKDLAQFAIDGGTLIIGIAEETATSPARLNPVPLKGLPERVERIALSRPDPPLPVACKAIPSSNDPAQGYLVVSVSPTGAAPHMVDGVYYGRGDKTKRQLCDNDVLRLHQGRKNLDQAAAEFLDLYVNRDPVPAEHREQAHFFVIAAPVSPRPEMLLDAIAGTGWRDTFQTLQNAASAIDNYPDYMGFQPSLHHVASWSRRPDGVARTYALTDDRRLERLVTQPDRYIENVFEFELTEDGAIRLMTSALSQGRDGQQISAIMIPVLVHQVLAIAHAIADHTDYHGSWMLGCAATGIAGLPAATDDHRVTSPPWPADVDTYQRTCTAAITEIAQTPGKLTRRLTGQLLRGLGEADRLGFYLKD